MRTCPIRPRTRIDPVNAAIVKAKNNDIAEAYLELVTTDAGYAAVRGCCV